MFFILFHPHLVFFITAGHFPALSPRDQRAGIDIHPSHGFMKAKSFTGRKERYYFFFFSFPGTICPRHPTPQLTPPLLPFITGRGNGCRTFLKLDE